jgi:mono/diheme cytochrome c family protein
LKWFVLGIVITLVVLAGGAYLFVKAGGISMETTAPPLPLEKTVADMALRASLGHAADQKNPLRFNNDTMLAAAQKYKQNCAVCHGTPGQPRTPISKGMFPDPPRNARCSSNPEVAPVFNAVYD